MQRSRRSRVSQLFASLIERARHADVHLFGDMCQLDVELLHVGVRKLLTASDESQAAIGNPRDHPNSGMAMLLSE